MQPILSNSVFDTSLYKLTLSVNGTRSILVLSVRFLSLVMHFGIRMYQCFLSLIWYPKKATSHCKSTSILQWPSSSASTNIAVRLIRNRRHKPIFVVFVCTWFWDTCSGDCLADDAISQTTCQHLSAAAAAAAMPDDGSRQQVGACVQVRPYSISLH